MTYDLEGKVVLITGAAGGIGSAAARELYVQGASLVLTDTRQETVDLLAREFDARRVLPLALAKVGVPVPEDAAWLVGLYAVVIALLMVSRLPTFSGKSIGADIPRDSVLPVLVAVVLFTALLVSYPYSVIAAGTVLYLAHLPFAWAAWRKRAAVGETAAKATRTGGSGPH